MTAEFDRYSRSYDEAVNSATSFSGLSVDFFARVKAECFVDLIGSLSSPALDAEVLDVGCGVGSSHTYLAGRVGRLVGIDLSQACISAAAERHPQNKYFSYDGRQIPFADKSFDAASAVCVFHHIPVVERRPLVGEIRRVLRTAGLFAMFEHNPFNPLTRAVVNRCEFDRDAILLRSREAEALFRDSGFHDVRTQFFLTIPVLSPRLRSLDRILGRLPLGAQYVTVGLS